MPQVADAVDGAKGVFAARVPQPVGHAGRQDGGAGGPACVIDIGVAHVVPARQLVQLGDLTLKAADAGERHGGGHGKPPHEGAADAHGVQPGLGVQQRAAGIGDVLRAQKQSFPLEGPRHAGEEGKLVGGGGGVGKRA